MATTYLTRTPSSAGGQRTLTWSYWIKKNPGTPSSTYKLFDCGNSSNYLQLKEEYLVLQFQSWLQLNVLETRAGITL